MAFLAAAAPAAAAIGSTPLAIAPGVAAAAGGVSAATAAGVTTAATAGAAAGGGLFAGFGLTEALSAASSVVGAAGAVSSSQAQANAAEANAEIAAENARLERRRAAREERLFRRRLSSLKGEQRAGFAKAGIQLEGSPLLIVEETAREGEREARAIREGGEVASRRFRKEAAVDRTQARSTRQTGAIRSGKTLLGGASKVFSG